MNTATESLFLALRRHWLPALAAFTSVIGSAVVYLVSTPPQYEALTRLILDDRSVSISPLGQNLSEVQNRPPGDANPLATQSELVTSQQVLGRVLEKLKTNPSFAVQSLTTDELEQDLQVSIIPATNILEVTYQHNDPQLAVLVLDTLAESMVEESADAVRLGASSVRSFLESEVPLQQARLARAEALENRYRQQSGLVSPETQTRSLVNSLAEMENRERELTSQLQAAYTRSAGLRDVTGTQSIQAAYASVQAGQNATLTALQAKLTELETQVIQARSRLGDQHPDLQALVQQRDETRSLYSRELQTVLANYLPAEQLATGALSQTLIADLITGEIERAAVQDQLKVVQSDRSRLSQRLAALPAQQQQLTILSREREEAAKTLASLRTKLEEARIAEAQLVSSIRIIDRPWAPDGASWPNPLVVLVVAAVAGAVLGAGVVVAMEVLDGTVRDAGEAAEILQLPILGVLPKLPPSALELESVDEFLNSPDLAQPYQMFLKTMEMRSQKPIRILAISSVSMGEGKSTVVAHLAAVAAMTKRILVIDADLRCPVQHASFHLPPRPGLTDVLRGDVRLAEAAQPTKIPSLSLLTHGTSSQHPAAILESPEMEQLLLEARANYDLVIVDTPPVGLSAETLSLGQHSDALVLVVRPQLTVRSRLRQVVDELTSNGLPLLGIAVNGAKRRTALYYPEQTNAPMRPWRREEVRSGSGEVDRN
jgi:capsular exopolysaccharide synthesis family protein